MTSRKKKLKSQQFNIHANICNARGFEPRSIPNKSQDKMVIQDDEYFAPSVSVRTIGEMINASQYPSNTSELAEYDTNRHISKILILSTFPFILLIGTVGNSLTFIIMQRGSLKHSSTCFYMAILALADSSKFNILIFVVVTKS